MNHRSSLYAAFVCFVIALAFFWVGRAEIAKSMVLMGVVSFWFLMAFLFALHADTTGNLQVIVQNFPLIGGLLNGKSLPPNTPVAPPADDTKGPHE